MSDRCGGDSGCALYIIIFLLILIAFKVGAC